MVVTRSLVESGVVRSARRRRRSSRWSARITNLRSSLGPTGPAQPRRPVRHLADADLGAVSRAGPTSVLLAATRRVRIGRPGTLNSGQPVRASRSHQTKASGLVAEVAELEALWW